MKARNSKDSSLNQKRCDFLLTYRTTPHTTTKRTPAELMGRRLKTRLDLLCPNTSERIQEQSSGDLFKKPTRLVTIGDTVLARDYRNRKETWISGIVTERLSPCSYHVAVGDMIWKRHIDQLRRVDESAYRENPVEMTADASQFNAGPVVFTPKGQEIPFPTAGITDTASVTRQSWFGYLIKAVVQAVKPELADQGSIPKADSPPLKRKRGVDFVVTSPREKLAPKRSVRKDPSPAQSFSPSPVEEAFPSSGDSSEQMDSPTATRGDTPPRGGETSCAGSSFQSSLLESCIPPRREPKDSKTIPKSSSRIRQEPTVPRENVHDFPQEEPLGTGDLAASPQGGEQHESEHAFWQVLSLIRQLNKFKDPETAPGEGKDTVLDQVYGTQKPQRASAALPWSQGDLSKESNRKALETFLLSGTRSIKFQVHQVTNLWANSILKRRDAVTKRFHPKVPAVDVNRLKHSSIIGRALFDPQDVEQTAERWRKTNQDLLLQRALTSRLYKPPAPQQPQQQPRRTLKQAPAAKKRCLSHSPFPSRTGRLESPLGEEGRPSEPCDLPPSRPADLPSPFKDADVHYAPSKPVIAKAPVPSRHKELERKTAPQSLKRQDYPVYHHAAAVPDLAPQCSPARVRAPVPVPRQGSPAPPQPTAHQRLPAVPDIARQRLPAHTRSPVRKSSPVHVS
ncbi:serine/arginine repetitive matrix protein 1-like [Palaemon carinicauda]|uniref:serine/arginine repetitive matrix protein 1-like n=1 Tax=Palaemon carinicauda TaxID=392227 RepID=UPI0035B6869F